MTDTVSLQYIHVPVIGMGHPLPDPSIIIGASLDSPLGPRVAIGAGMNIGGKGLALVAHLTADEALSLSSKLLTAAAEIAEIEGLDVVRS